MGRSPDGPADRSCAQAAPGDPGPGHCRLALRLQPILQFVEADRVSPSSLLRSLSVPRLTSSAALPASIAERIEACISFTTDASDESRRPVVMIRV